MCKSEWLKELRTRREHKPKTMQSVLAYRILGRQKAVLEVHVNADEARAMLICAACRKLDG